ncbi:HNH endonuclease signature motif containing protein [Mycolicibacterium mengxianglii]|uniref:HNH endonuclease signature motif containing protein n=1 Tax=Mycolicibacterium mengxianglii TaxID=2736649 RepID=UPI0018EF10C9|nr:HNH endonuclease signature motif containing protein [Mycolicibacterium mengxianglii]
MGHHSAAAEREAMLAAVAQLETLTHRMNRLSVDGFTPAELLDLQQRREAVHRAQPVLDHKIYQRLQHDCTPTELGGTSYHAVLSQRLRISTTEAHRRLDDAAALGPRTAMTGEPLEPLLPNMARGQAQGLISSEHIAKVRWFFAKVPSFVDYRTRARCERTFARLACEQAPNSFARAVEEQLYLLNQDGEFTEQDCAKSRGATVGRQNPDGTRNINITATPELSALFEAVTAKLAAPGMCNPEDDQPTVDGAPSDDQVRRDTRTQSQRNHDALIAGFRALLASGELGQHNGLPAVVIVTTTLAELQKGAGLAVTAGGTKMPMRDVIRLASHAYHYLCIFDDDGVPLHLGRSKRLASPGQRIVLLAKDRGCTAPGCAASGYQCQVHHATRDWKQGGRTDIEDLTLACGPHNRLIENTGWTTGKRADGITEWVPPPELDCGQSRINTYHHPERLLGSDDDEVP